jgi:excisionase family DNA binding protein
MKSVLSDVSIPHWRQELRPREAAAMLGVSIGMVYLLIREGKLRSRALVRNGYQRGIRLIRRTDVEALCSPAQNQERTTSQTGRRKKEPQRGSPQAPVAAGGPALSTSDKEPSQNR